MIFKVNENFQLFFDCLNTESKAELAENVANIKTTKMRLI